MRLGSKFRKISRCHTFKSFTILVFHLVICQPLLFPRMHLDKCRGNKIKTLAACEHAIKNILYSISKQYFYINFYSSTWGVYTEKNLLSIQSTLRLKGDLTSTGLKDNLNEYNSFFKLEGKVFIFSKLFRISFLMIYISRI